jgi:hypothetical protein
MLSFIKKLFGSKPEEAAAPYKVEAPVEAPVNEAALPFPASKPTKKPTAKKAPAKPRKPKSTKA